MGNGGSRRRQHVCNFGPPDLCNLRPPLTNRRAAAPTPGDSCSGHSERLLRRIGHGPPVSAIKSFDPGYFRDIAGIRWDARLWRAQRLTGIGRDQCGFAVSKQLRRATLTAPLTRRPSPGPQKPARETITRTLVATLPHDASRCPVPPAAPTEIALKSPTNPRLRPARSRSASTDGTEWRRGQSRANPSRHDLGKCPQIVESTPVPPGTMTSRVVGMAP